LGEAARMSQPIGKADDRRQVGHPFGVAGGRQKRAWEGVGERVDTREDVEGAGQHTVEGR